MFVLDTNVPSSIQASSEIMSTPIGCPAGKLSVP